MEDQPHEGSTRQLPVFFCPYCGDEELSPHGDGGEWLDELHLLCAEAGLADVQITERGTAYNLDPR